jgi:ribose 1,5-bisphosphate isomerase
MTISPEITNLINEIKNDRVHGASQLARQAALVLKIAAEQSHSASVVEFLAELSLVGTELMSVRPAMAPIYNMVNRLLKSVSVKAAKIELTTIRQLTITRADKAIKDSYQAVKRIARYGCNLITGSDIIITHSYSSTVMDTLKAAYAKYPKIKVIATRSGPGRTGERIARELGQYGVSVTFIDDTAIGLYTATANKVMVGADRICADGKLINGIGTYPLALAAKRAGIPFYVLGETLKFDPRLRGNEVDLEEKDASEVMEMGKLPPEVRVKNPYFDITPPELITGIVTEDGVLKPQDIVGYINNLPDLS